jgi:Mn2+/Fe2+ NRAMP family transporter
MAAGRRWFKSIGPGLITACVVIGPGSILTSSNVGATYGYGMSWVVVVAVLFMMVYMTLGAKLGVISQRSSGDLVTQKAGRFLAVLIGLGVFFISAAFQFGNNLGVHAAFQTYIDFKYTVVAFNALTLAFLFGFKNLYQVVERMMACFVGLMLVAFAINLAFAGPHLGAWARGFVPQFRSESGDMLIDISVLGLVGTTFVVTAAYYQAYLARFKGWRDAELRSGLIDARVGSAIMAIITLMLMATPATVFYSDFQHERVVADAGGSGLDADVTLVIDDADQATYEALKKKADVETDWKTGAARWKIVLPASQFKAEYANASPMPTTKPRSFRDLPEVGTSLAPLFGAMGPPLFFLGVFAAAYSSFLVNSMIGGFILADGFGLGSTPSDRWPRIFTAAVLLVGMGVALYVIETGVRPVAAIVAAQAVTVIASPLMAGALLWLTNRRDVMGEHRNGPVMNIAAAIAFAVLLAMAWYTAAFKVWPVIRAAL